MAGDTDGNMGEGILESLENFESLHPYPPSYPLPYPPQSRSSRFYRCSRLGIWMGIWMEMRGGDEDLGSRKPRKPRSISPSISSTV